MESARTHLNPKGDSCQDETTKSTEAVGTFLSEFSRLRPSEKISRLKSFLDSRSLEVEKGDQVLSNQIVERLSSLLETVFADEQRDLDEAFQLLYWIELLYPNVIEDVMIIILSLLESALLEDATRLRNRDRYCAILQGFLEKWAFLPKYRELQEYLMSQLFAFIEGKSTIDKPSWFSTFVCSEIVLEVFKSSAELFAIKSGHYVKTFSELLFDRTLSDVIPRKAKANYLEALLTLKVAEESAKRSGNPNIGINKFENKEHNYDKLSKKLEDSKNYDQSSLESQLNFSSDDSTTIANDSNNNSKEQPMRPRDPVSAVGFLKELFGSELYYSVSESKPLTVGRNTAKCNVILADKRVSREHFKIKVVHGKAYLSNPYGKLVFLNDVPFKGYDFLLHHGEIITIASDYSFVFLYKEDCSDQFASVGTMSSSVPPTPPRTPCAGPVSEHASLQCSPANIGLNKVSSLPKPVPLNDDLLNKSLLGPNSFQEWRLASMRNKGKLPRMRRFTKSTTRENISRYQSLNDSWESNSVSEPSAFRPFLPDEFDTRSSNKENDLFDDMDSWASDFILPTKERVKKTLSFDRDANVVDSPKFETLRTVRLPTPFPSNSELNRVTASRNESHGLMSRECDEDSDEYCSPNEDISSSVASASDTPRKRKNRNRLAQPQRLETTASNEVNFRPKCNEETISISKPTEENESQDEYENVDVLIENERIVSN